MQLITLDEYNGGRLSERCKLLDQAFNAHEIDLCNMEYALMQYEIAEALKGEVRNNRPVPEKPAKPSQPVSVEERDKYNEKLRSHLTAVNQNYEGTQRLKAIEAFNLAIKDDDRDYSKGKEWGAYIVTGVVDGAVKAYLEYQQLYEEAQNE